MLDRRACERRVYRLAVLLTGNPVAATKVIEQVVGAQPDLRRLDGAHTDRLTVLRSREIPAGRLAADQVSAASAEALALLPPQQREAWVFARVYRLEERPMARAMDCSVTAARRHLEQADAGMHAATGGAADAAAGALLQYTLALDVPEFFRAARTRRRRLRLALIGGAIVLAAAGVLAALRWAFGG